MSVMLFKLRGVGDDEAEELRQALRQNDIDFYETPAGRWGVSMPAFWLRDDAQLHQARTVIEQYQQQRSSRVRQEYDLLKKAGRAETFLARLKSRPMTVLIYIIMLAFVMIFFIMPFIHFAR